MCAFGVERLNLNGLLVTRQIDNTSPGGGGGSAPGGNYVRLWSRASKSESEWGGGVRQEGN